MKNHAQEIVPAQREARENALGLRELRYFLSVAQTGNIGRSALALNVSQPAISMQLRKLEQSLGMQLLMRHRRGMTLTTAGACLRDRANAAMQLLMSPIDPETYYETPETVSLGITAELGNVIIPSLAKAFQCRWPQARLVVQEGRGSTLEELLIHRHVDVAVLEEPPVLTELKLVPVLRAHLGLVTPIDPDGEEDGRPVAVRDLAQYSLILPREQHWLRRRLDHVALQRGIRLSPALQVDSVGLTKTLVRSGFGYSILPYSVVQEEAARGELVFRPIWQPLLSCNSSVAFHRAAAGTHVSTFADMIRTSMATLAKKGAWPGTEVITGECANR